MWGRHPGDVEALEMLGGHPLVGNKGKVHRAGTASNPSYGIFPSEWIDVVWCGGEEGEAKVVIQVTNPAQSSPAGQGGGGVLF